MTNTDFLKLNATGQTAELIKRVKDTLQKGEEIKPTFYFFDIHEELFVMQITEQFLIKSENKNILRQIVKEKIKDLKKQNVIVEKILFLREGYYSVNHPNKNEMNLDTDFNKKNSNEALIVSMEDDFDLDLKIYDVIKIYDEGKTFMVMSKDPIEELNISKVDPESSVKSIYSNLL